MAITVAELLAKAKRKRDRIQRKAIKKVEKAIPPILGPGGRVAPSIARGATDVQNALMDALLDQAFGDLGSVEIGPSSRPQRTFDPNNPITRLLKEMEFPSSGSPPTKKVRVRSDKQMVNDQIQSIALKSINKRARKKDGSFKKGWSQKRVMRLAQRECTKERERLGLCKRKSTRKGQRRKTARRAYESAASIGDIRVRRRR